MRIVVATDSCMHPYLRQLRDALLTHSSVEQVVFNLDAFWSGPFPDTLLHLQWPEAVFGWRDVAGNEIKRFNDKIQDWKAASCIVATVHNYHPHNRPTKSFHDLYESVYRSADGLVHLGWASLDWVSRTYDLPDSLLHRVIPSGHYGYFDDNVDREEARRRLGLHPQDFVCLSFGALRSERELRLLIDGFKALRSKRKRLLVAGTIAWPSRRRAPAAHLRWRGLIHLTRGVELHARYILDGEVQVFLNAADVVVIPRIYVLNSGNVPLGFTFGRVVVGPNVGVIGELLRQTGNPTYIPGDAKDLARALEEGQAVSKHGLGDRNRRHATENWDWGTVGAQHVEFYLTLLDRRTGHVSTGSAGGR